MRQANSSPGLLAVARDEGSYVFDHDGCAYFDLHGNNCHHIGYCHLDLMAGLVDQLGTLPFNTRGFTNAAFVDLAEKLSAAWPGADGRVFMVPGSAVAVELAQALARVHTGSHKSLSFADSYHGRSLGASSLTARRPTSTSVRLGWARCCPMRCMCCRSGPRRSPIVSAQSAHQSK